MKIVIADPKDGHCYQVELDEIKSKPFYGLRISNEVEGSLIGLNGYKVKITGGSDKEGFPMRQGFHGSSRKQLLISSGAGIKKVSKNKTKKTVRGDTITEEVSQINVKITKAGDKKITELLGISPKEEKKEGAKE